MTPQQAYEQRYSHLGAPTSPATWDAAPPHVKDMWLAAWTISGAINREDEREQCAKLCMEWARICEAGKRWGCRCGAEECAKLIRTQGDTEGEET